jgi:Zn-dependent protease with chaperone function
VSATDPLSSIALLATVWVLGAGMLAVTTRLLWPLVARRSQAWAPRVRARRLATLAVAPAVVPTFTLGLCVLPGVLGWLSGRGDHCSIHLDHPHLCLFHASIAFSPLLALGLMIFVLLLLAAWRQGLRWIVLERRTRRDLDATATGQGIERARLARSAIPFALTGGWIRPRVWLSTALFDALPPARREIVLAHERAHAERRDPLLWAVASTLAGLHLPGTRDPLLADLRLAAEQDCDERAAARVGDRLEVAETLLFVERLMKKGGPLEASSGAHAGLTGSTVPQRIQRLLCATHDDPKEQLPLPLVYAGVALLAGSGARPLHHAAEHLLEIASHWLAAIV